MMLYLHIPFCVRKCAYCDFVSYAGQADKIGRYVEAMLAEMDRRPSGETVTSVFFGGGTPSLLPPEALSRLLAGLRQRYALAPDCEISAEVNPGTVTDKWLAAAVEGGVNRLSVGVQAVQPELLQRIGRIHDFAKARETFALARAAGIQNLSADLMYALPGQTLTDWEESLRAVLSLAPAHVSCYALTVAEGTPFGDLDAQGRLPRPEEDEEMAMQDSAVRILGQAGLARYEVSNYAQPGFACRHNVGYWQGSWYAGLGVAAHGMLPPDASQASQGAVRVRRANTERMTEYLHALEAQNVLPPAEITLIDRQEAMFETMMLGLRMTGGVSERDFERMHGAALLQVYGPALEKLAQDGLGAWSSGTVGERRFFLTPRGLEVQNEALMALMP